MRSSDWSSRVLFRSTSAVVPVFAFPMTSTRTTASLDILKRVDSRGPGHPPWQGRNYAIHRHVLPVAIGKKIEDPGIVAHPRRSEERRVGNACVSTVRCRGSQDNAKKKKKTKRS